MMPDHRVTPADKNAGWVYRARINGNPLMDFEMGGVGYRDPSAGLLVKMWTAVYRDGGVYLSAEGVEEVLLFSRPGITELALAFDRNMNAVVGFTDAGGSTFWYFSSLSNQMEFFPYLPTGSVTVRCVLDDKRPAMSNTSDVLIAYVRDRNLYYREQRDRYETEYLLQQNAGSGILNMGMSTGNRMQFRLRP